MSNNKLEYYNSKNKKKSSTLKLTHFSRVEGNKYIVYFSLGSCLVSCTTQRTRQGILEVETISSIEHLISKAFEDGEVVILRTGKSLVNLISSGVNYNLSERWKLAL